MVKSLKPPIGGPIVKHKKRDEHAAKGGAVKGVLFSKRKREKTKKRKTKGRDFHSLMSVYGRCACSNRTEKHEKKRGGVVLTTVLGNFFPAASRNRNEEGLSGDSCSRSGSASCKVILPNLFFFSIRLKKKLEKNEGF